MSTLDFFRSRLDAMVDMRHPLAVLAQRLPWGRIEPALAAKLTHQERAAQRELSEDLLAQHVVEFGAGLAQRRTVPSVHSPDGQLAVPEEQKWEELKSVPGKFTIRLSQSYRAVVARDESFMRFLVLSQDHDKAYGKKQVFHQFHCDFSR